MGGNWDTAAARRYHELTKHSYESVRRGARALDRANRPQPFKEYVDVEAQPLAQESELGQLLRWGAGVIRSRTFGGVDTYHFRTYSSAGALYPVEVYVADAEGLWHFHPLEEALRRIREEDVRGHLAETRMVIALTGILWRSAWKYGLRAYRHLFWDAGTMLANLLALAGAAALEARVLTGFVDREVNDVLGVDGEREAGLALLALGPSEPAPTAPARPALELAVAQLSRREEAYPEAYALHAASSLTTAAEVRRYRGGHFPEGSEPGRSSKELERVLRRRGSAREFASTAVRRAEAEAVLSAALGPIPADVPPANELYIVASAVEGLDPGAYRFTRGGGFELLRAGAFRLQAGYLALEQALGARAAVTAFLLADLEQVLAAHGNRGYRAVQLEAGIRTGRVYLEAYARGLGATASTFYDDDVSAFFAPGTSLAPLLCIAFGRTA